METIGRILGGLESCMILLRGGWVRSHVERLKITGAGLVGIWTPLGGPSRPTREFSR